MATEDAMESNCGKLVVCDTREEMIEQFEEYKRDTQSGWRCVKSNDLFGKKAEEILQSKKTATRMQWSLITSEGISLPFDGVPFLCAGTIYYQCHQGNDIDKNTKVKRQIERDNEENHDHTFKKTRKRLQPTKKLGCPSKVTMSRILKFPEYKVVVGPNGAKPQRRMREAASLFKADLQAGKQLVIVNQFLIKLPNADSHKFHITEGKAALVIILDVGPAMCQAAPGHETPLETSIKAIKMIITRKMFTSPKDEVALVLFGTEETNNELADENGGYENISITRMFSPPDQEFLQYIHNEIIPGGHDADFIDAIVVATHLLNQSTLGKKCEKNMILFSNLGSPFGDDGLETIIDGLKGLETNFTVVGPNLYDDDDDDDAEENDNDTPGGPQTKPMSAQQKLGGECVKRILAEIEGQTFTLSDILPMLAFVEQKSIKQTTVFRGPMQIGSNVKISVYGYIRVKEQKPNSWKKLSAPAEVSAEPGSMEVKIQRTYHLKDEDETEVEQDDLVKGYRYGKTLVPFLKVDQQEMKLETEKCLEVLCFAPSSNIERQHFISDSVVVFVSQPDDQAAAIGLSAFIRALYESDKVAIVRYVARKNAAPKIGFLSPHIKENYECLLFTALPFAEDIRQYTFASLPSSSRQRPSDEQLKVVDEFVDSMLLTNEKSGQDDETEESLQPKKIFNPYRQRLFQCIVHRSLYPGEPLPEMEPVIARSIEQPEEVKVQVLPHLSRVKDLFPLKAVEKTKSDKKEENVFKNSSVDLDGVDREAKRRKLNADDVDTNMEALVKSEITEVGTVDPVGDFTYLVNQKVVDRFVEASKQMKERIIRLILDSFKAEFYEKAMACILVLRKESIKAGEGRMFNHFLEDLREMLRGKMKNSFWVRLKEEKVTLVNCSESSDVKVTEREAQSFLEDEEVKVEEEAVEEIDDVDDLLEMMG